MNIRLGVASLGVAGLAYATSPIAVMMVFLILVGGPVAYSAWISYSSIERPSLPPT